MFSSMFMAKPASVESADMAFEASQLEWENEVAAIDAAFAGFEVADCYGG